MGIASPSTLSPTGVKGGSQYFSYPNNPRRRGAESNIGKSLLAPPDATASVCAEPGSGLPSEIKMLRLPCVHIGANLAFAFFFFKYIYKNHLGIWTLSPVEFPSFQQMSDWVKDANGLRFL